jgi:hypothetical protein
MPLNHELLASRGTFEQFRQSAPGFLNAQGGGVHG